ncbi:unannotated protein [freshwater metagenome]|uniref:Unannotated protein n=1 Tax=freshwater metagenome TaxID=449393 RepID=A0A6J7GH02_9ZZZZ
MTLLLGILIGQWSMVLTLKLGRVFADRREGGSGA